MSGIHFEETRYGFKWGSMEITRLFSDEKRGAVTIEVKTPKKEIQIYATRTGKVRITSREGEWLPPKKRE